MNKERGTKESGNSEERITFKVKASNACRIRTPATNCGRLNIVLAPGETIDPPMPRDRESAVIVYPTTGEEEEWVAARDEELNEIYAALGSWNQCDSSLTTEVFDEYQDMAGEFAVYPGRYAGRYGNIYYPALGLASEVGEVVGLIKKVMRDYGGIVTNDAQEKLKDELGDVLWYVAALATELRLGLGEIATRNLFKLYRRQQRGTIHGSGDDR